MLRYQVTRSFIKYHGVVYREGDLLPEYFGERDRAQTLYTRRLTRIDIPDEPLGLPSVDDEPLKGAADDAEKAEAVKIPAAPVIPVIPVVPAPAVPVEANKKTVKVDASGKVVVIPAAPITTNGTKTTIKPQQ